jgi:hypothetical protein
VIVAIFDPAVTRIVSPQAAALMSACTAVVVESGPRTVPGDGVFASAVFIHWANGSAGPSCTRLMTWLFELQYGLLAPVTALTVIDKACVAVAATLSLTRRVKLDVPVPVGVPEMTPVELLSVNPVGNVPTVTVHEPYGGVPPAAANVTLYAWFWVAAGKLLVVICKGTGEGLIVSGNVVVAVWGVEHESVTRICGLKAPLTEGVPLIRPPAAIDTPVGKLPANKDQETDPIPPLLVIWKL